MNKAFKELVRSVPPVSVKDEGTWCCVYCGKELPEQHSECCGEVGHTEFVTNEA